MIYLDNSATTRTLPAAAEAAPTAMRPAASPAARDGGCRVWVTPWAPKQVLWAIQTEKTAIYGRLPYPPAGLRCAGWVLTTQTTNTAFPLP